MKIFLIFAFLFAMGSFLGWILEFFFRKAVGKKWVNPGFLAGPCLPIYGIGLCFLVILSYINLDFISNDFLRNFVTILIMGTTMVIIEYIAGLIFIKGFKVKLWDYSDRWGNIQGIICPLFTVIWIVISTIYYFFINPYIIKAIAWFTNNLMFSFVIGIFYGVLFVDLFYSFRIIHRVKTFATKHQLVVKYEKFKESVNLKNGTKKLLNFLFPFRFPNFENEKIDYIEIENDGDKNYNNKLK